MSGRISAMMMAFGLTIIGAGLAAATPQGSAIPAVPPYHSSPPAKPFPATLDPKQFPDAVNHNVYAFAAKIKPVLYQQPCYCGCDREAGHRSLLDCFVDTHASVCSTCKEEGLYAYLETKKGKTPAQIRAGIIKGEWKNVDMTPYTSVTPRH